MRLQLLELHQILSFISRFDVPVIQARLSSDKSKSVENTEQTLTQSDDGHKLSEIHQEETRKFEWCGSVSFISLLPAGGWWRPVKWWYCLAGEVRWPPLSCAERAVTNTVQIWPSERTPVNSIQSRWSQNRFSSSSCCRSSPLRATSSLWTLTWYRYQPWWTVPCPCRATWPATSRGTPSGSFSGLGRTSRLRFTVWTVEVRTWYKLLTWDSR